MICLKKKIVIALLISGWASSRKKGRVFSEYTLMWRNRMDTNILLLRETENDEIIIMVDMQKHGKT